MTFNNIWNCFPGHFTKYIFKETYDNFVWTLNPFVAAKTDLSGPEEGDLAKQKALASFWLSVVDEYPLLSQKSTKILFPFTTTYMCETGAQPALHFRGGGIFMKLRSMSSSCLFNRGTTFSQTVAYSNNNAFLPADTKSIVYKHTHSAQR